MEIEEILAKGADAAIEQIGKAVSKVTGSPAGEFGELLADHIRFRRAKNLAEFYVKYQRIVEEAGIDQREVPFKLWFPIFDSASIEEDDSLQQKWAALLANAANPRPHVEVTPAFVELLKQISPLEAKLLHFAYVEMEPDHLFLSGFHKHVEVTSHQVWVSLENVNRLGLLGGNLPEVTNQDLDSARQTAYYERMGIYLTQVLGNSPYMLWSSVARVAVPPTSDL